MHRICTDLKQEHEALDSLVSSLPRENWDLVTPFYHWTLFDQILHLAFFDHESWLALHEPDRFQKRAKKILDHIGSGQHWPEWTRSLSGIQTPEALMPYWRNTRAQLLDTLREIPPRERLAWYGTDMGARSLASARLMETWAHGQDIWDALKRERKNRAGLYHVAHLGFTTFEWSFRIRGLKPPANPPGVVLTGPKGESWKWGDPESPEQVWGSALDFCLVVTQRRNLADTRLKYRGDNTKKWLSLAQAFAGIPQNPPGPGVRTVHKDRGTQMRTGGIKRP